ncbi:Asp-tRNA(Asn)/Glu-tRNA(Gln) amidotransferase GatCAB subunit A [Ktedonobacter racemifer]|uniref:Amidase n=1 Tax=Ktedonobacter racemifer DSM 44963 TaxID=485913 RepID=D6TPE0_KTERA|nr:Asp-tRNA(Asn)/Glu-tRNA(Gln) amidotransferase GatCAB subunit A [Ktedonobacter racemifer]EFH87496.1 Amidase [Ktedonobacter racemifer DSM 44963]
MSYLSIREVAEELQAGIITPTELVEETLNLIEERDTEVEAFVTVMREEAMAQAEQAERELRTGLKRGPLHGIPIAIKDLIAVKGVRTTGSSQVLAEHVSEEDATVIELLRKSGAILIGKTNTYEFAYGPYAPPTRNPWDLTRTTGGSSGGSAAAVAAGMVLGAIGTDTGGSIRIPSALCGVTGLKPTYGRVSCHGVLPLSWSLDHVGPIARSAEDCAFIFDAIAKYDPRDPNSVSGPPSSPSRSTATLIEGAEGRGPLSLQGLRLGMPQEGFVAPLDPEIHMAWRGALHVLEENGAELVNVELPRPTMTTYRMVQKPEASLAHMQQGWFPHQGDLYTELVRTRLREGQEIPAVEYLKAQQERRVFTSQLRSILRTVDAFVLPTQAMAAIPAEQMGQEVTINGVQENATDAMLRMTMPFNLVGFPAVSFPCGFTSEHLPIGLQIAGKPFEEATVLRIAHAYQQLTDWHRREAWELHQ